MKHEVIGILEECRTHLQECASTPLDIELYRDDIVKECNIGTDLLKDLRDLEKKSAELEETCIAVKDLPNKMQYSKTVQERIVVKNKIRDTSNQLKAILRTNGIVINNHKRTILEIDRVDDILFKTIKEMVGTGDITTLRHCNNNYVSPLVAKEQSLAKMKAVVKAMEELIKISGKEHLEHRDSVELLKRKIKQTSADIDDIQRGCYAPAMKYTNELSEKRASEVLRYECEKRSMLEEIEQLKTSISNQSIVHEANINSLNLQRKDLEQKMESCSKINSKSMYEMESILMGLKKEHAENQAALQRLEERWENDKAKERAKKEEEELHQSKLAEARKLEEKQHFAALWIQLRWRAFLKRRLKKQGSTKNKKGKKGKKAKK